MSLLENLYSAAVHALRPLLPAFGAASPKVSAAVEGRRVAAGAIAGWAERERDPFRPLLWLHGASAGELAGAVPVVAGIRRERPDTQLLVTYSSPSAEVVLADLAPDYAGYPPLETRAACRAAFESARPDALVFAKLDAWPGMTRAAAEAGVPIGMINATVRPGSTRLRGPGRQLLIPSYGRLELVGAVSESEKDRLRRLGARPEAIRITGDASFERSLERLEQAGRKMSRSGSRLPPAPGGTFRLVAGSTWPEDERILIEAAASIRAARPETSTPDLELVLVPHEPDAVAVKRIRELCRDRLGVEPRLWSSLEHADRPARGPNGGISPLVVDVVGILADLYLECDAAWVGGGIGGEGLHSVVEPAAAGVPVLFGPVHDRWEADALVERGAARELSPDEAGSALERLLEKPADVAAMGRAGRAYVESGRGAGQASARLILELMEGSRPV